MKHKSYAVAIIAAMVLLGAVSNALAQYAWIDHFAPPGAWSTRDENPNDPCNCWAELTDNGDGTAEISMEPWQGWAKVESQQHNFYVPSYPVLQIKVDSIEPNASLVVGLRKQQDAWEYVELTPSITQPGIYCFNIHQMTGWGNMKFIVELQLRCPYYQAKSAVIDYAILRQQLDPPPYTAGSDDEYFAGDWDGDGHCNVATRRVNHVLMEVSYDGVTDFGQIYGAGNWEDEYLIGDWDGDGTKNIGVRRGNVVFLDVNHDWEGDIVYTCGNGNSEDQYLVGDWLGIGKDYLGVRRSSYIHLDLDGNGTLDALSIYGLGNSEDQYLVGDWNGDGADTMAVRRGNVLLINTNWDGVADMEYAYGYGQYEDQYLVGDWDGDGDDNIAVRRGNAVYMDYDFNTNGQAEFIQWFGAGTP